LFTLRRPRQRPKIAQQLRLMAGEYLGMAEAADAAGDSLESEAEKKD
jgi:hypothetical protein